jgi:hypothetical protein
MACCEKPEIVHARDVSIYRDVRRISLDGTELILSDNFRMEDQEPDNERWFCGNCDYFFEMKEDVIACLTDPAWTPTETNGTPQSGVGTG